MKTHIVKARWERKVADLWVGLFVRMDYPDFDSDLVHKLVHIWICFLPCFPLHLQVYLSQRWYASWWLIRLRCDSETWLNGQERWFYALKALWCLWMRPTVRRACGMDEVVIAAIWNVFANAEGHSWTEVTVGAGTFRNWWAEVHRESE